MTVSLLNETRFTLSRAAQQCGVSTGAVVRWALYGIQGGRLKLESYRLGGKRYTTKEALERFITAQNPDVPLPTGSTTPDTESRIAAAERELAKAGI